MATGDSILTCDNKDLISIWSMLSSCFGKDVDGNIILRICQTSCPETAALSCSDTTLTDYEQFIQLLRQAIVLDGNGNPALSISTNCCGA